MNTDGIIYIPQYDTYRIKVGKRTVEIEAWAFKRIWDLNMVEDILRSNNGNLKNNLFEAIIKAGGKLVSNPWDYASACGNDYISSYDPIDTLYRSMPDSADTVVACMDLPRPTPYYDPSATPTVYHHNRFPSAPASTIISEAIKLLNAKKNLNLTGTTIDQVFDGFKLVMQSKLFHPYLQWIDKTSVILIKHAAFDRAHRTDIDAYAGLRAKLDTDTYIRLRIAFLLYQAVTKIEEWNKERLNSDIFEVIRSDVK